ncbi:MAG: cyclohexa-1,5-dienecarbonyl-CoA hydratase [Planctomycetes bacterium]|nr:cyclohexa-1,5-dienecarbonyl-CoA hydratase [Planctomycetota bacterium]
MTEECETASPLRIERGEGDRLWLLRLDRPKANIVDAAMTKALQDAFCAAQQTPSLRAIVLAHSGPNFSFGASVAEHLPGEVAGMLRDFHALFHTMAETEVPLLAAVNGHCLGGGLELVAFTQRIFAAPTCKLGQPEIALGVFAPVASALLPHRIGRAAAEDLCLSGRTIGGDEALRLGLVDELAEDPEAAAVAYAESHLLRHSASSLHHALRAVRRHFLADFFARLAELERSYLDELMATADATEGITAFLEKRQPQWSEA